MSIAISSQDLTYEYAPRVGAVDLDLLVPEGMVYGFLGPNGAGKSTAIRMLTPLSRRALAGAEVGVDRVLLATLPMLMFGLLVGCVALLVSTLTGAPSTATGLGWMTVLISFLANSLGELIDSLQWLSSINPWTWHGAGEAITGDFNLGNFALLVLSTAVIASAAIISFTRRNLHL